MSKNNNELVKWQRDCLGFIENENFVILSAPTGSGKTRCYEKWAFGKKERPIFITSPIKALSNQRFRELTARGYKVGLSTGDVHYMPYDNPDIICCTQEIYNDRYRECTNSILIIDEFSYIFENYSRARCYIDSLKYSKVSNILVCSATFGNLAAIKEYLDRITGQSFFLYENNERLTSLEYRDEISKKDIKNSLVVAYSVENCRSIALKLYADRQKKLVSNDAIRSFQAEIIGIAQKYNIKNTELISLATGGVAYYFGKLYPKEKLYIEELFEKRLIDTVIGTDALALGVNFPIENVIFTDFYKINEIGFSKISKNLFVQLAGRAGRKQYFDKGYVYWCGEFSNLDKSKLRSSYQSLLVAEQENFTIELTPKIKDILLGKSTVEEEATYITNFSTGCKDYEEVRDEIQKIIDFITKLDITAYVIKQIYNVDISNGFYMAISKFNNETKRKIEALTEALFKLQPYFEKDIGDAYFEEYSYKENIDRFIDILLGKSLDELIKKYGNYLLENDRVDMRKMMQLRKYLHNLPSKYSKEYDLAKFDEFVEEIDATVFYPYMEFTPVSSDTLERIQKELELTNNGNKSEVVSSNLPQKVEVSLTQSGNSDIKNKKSPLENKGNKKKGKGKKTNNKGGATEPSFDIISIQGRKYIKIMMEKNKILVCRYFETGPLKLYYIPLNVMYIPVGRISYHKMREIWNRIDFSTLGNSLSQTWNKAEGSFDKFYELVRTKSK